MIRRDLLAGHWKPYLEHAVSLKPCYEGGINGGEVSSSFLGFHDCPKFLFLVCLASFNSCLRSFSLLFCM